MEMLSRALRTPIPGGTTWPAASPQPFEPHKSGPREELADLQLVVRARNGDRHGRTHPALHRLRAFEGELVLPRARRVRRSQPGRPHRALQGSAGLPPRTRKRRSVASPSSASRVRSSRRSRPPPASSTLRSTHTSRSARPRRDRTTVSAPSAMRSRGPASTTQPSASSRRRSFRALSFAWVPASRPLSRTHSASTSRATPRRWPRIGLRHEDDRQRAPAREAQGAPAQSSRQVLDD